MSTRPNVRAHAPGILVGALVFALLYVSRLYSYLLFHSLAELFAVVVAACVFMVIWNSRKLIENQYLLFLGSAVLFIAAVDALHLLTYKGMSVFPGVSADVPTQLWVLARAMQAAAFFIAPFLFGLRVRARTWLIAWSIPAIVLVGLIFLTDAFPACLDANGLTSFKIIAELVISGVLVLSLFGLRRHAGRFRPSVLSALSWSIGVTVVSELAFILYVDPYGPLNLIGHFLRIMATYLLYKAIIETALTEPHTVLFRELSVANSALQEREIAAVRAMELSDAMNGIDAAVNSTLELDQILRRALVGATDVLGADSSKIAFRVGDTWTVKYVYGLPQELVGTVLKDSEARHLVIAAEGRIPIVISDAMHDHRADSSLMARYDIRSLLTVPLVAADEVIGILTFHMRSSTKQFDADGREFATRLAVALALAIENARLYASQREIADTLQNAMLFFPQELPGVDLGHAYRSADELALIGGDFYAAFELADGRVGLVLGDVSGKGILAATASSMVRTTLHAFSLGGARPAEVLAATNLALLELLPDGVFATATYAEINTKTGTAILCSAGHPDPFICTGVGCVRYDARRNRPLGLFDDSTYEEFPVTLNPGDSLVLFSDGLPDARRGKEFFGDERIAATLDAMRDGDPQLIVDTLMASVAEFAGRQHTDDIAIVAATIRSS